MKFGFTTLVLAAGASAAVLMPVTEAGVTVVPWYDRSMLEINAGLIECKKYIVIFARGTMEPDGNNGGLLVGEKFIGSLKKMLPGQVASQGVSYKAGVGGYMTGGNAAGIDTMIKMIKETVASCPAASLIIGGYSQGGQIVHAALNILPAALSPHIKAVAIFGDPYPGKKMKNIDPAIVDTICDKNDRICKGIPLPIGTHLTYGTSGKTTKAAEWVVKLLSGSS